MHPIGIAVSVVALAFTSAAAVFAQDVLVRLSGDRLRVSAPNLHFLTGKPLENMKNGLAVPFDIRVTILADNKTREVRTSSERFVISYDLWEERFSVARMLSSARASVSHLTAPAAEAWCLDKFAIPALGLPEDKPFWIRIDVRARDSREVRNADEEGTLSLATLIDLLSRPARGPGEFEWSAESMPVRLEELRRAANR